ncbi:MAG: ABC transporter ATP-binding protein [Myxococcota bacterium]
MAEIVLETLNKQYGPVQVVRDLDLAVGDGEIVCLLGGSGCGKTTTLRMIAGLEAPTSGRILIGGVQVSDGPRITPPEARRLGMVFQSYAVWPHLTVLRNVSFPLEMRRDPEARDKARRILETVQLDKLADRLPHQLSGGQQQRVALARALVAEPEVLLLDEPLSNLDAKLRAEMRDEIRSLVKRLGLTAVLVTHDHEEAFAVADRIALMDGGRIVQEGPPTELYDAPRTDVVARFLGLEELLAVRDGDVARIDGVAVPVRPTDDAPDDGACMLGFRTHAARLAEQGISATVVSRSYTGGGWRCRVRIGERELRVPGDAPVGAAVKVAVDRGFALALPARAPVGISPTRPSPG